MYVVIKFIKVNYFMKIAIINIHKNQNNYRQANSSYQVNNMTLNAITIIIINCQQSQIFK